jgi:hypothetical protein
MKWLLFFLIFLVTPVLAQPVDIEIFTNSAGDYFINYENHSLEKCNGTKCILEINETSNTTTTELSKSDILKIQMIIKDELSKVNTQSTTNETQWKALVNGVFEEKQANDRAWVSNTWMPANSDMTNLTLQNQELQGALNNFNGTIANLHGQIDAKQSEIDTLKKNNDLYWYLIIILATTSFALLIKNSDMIRAVREWREK